MDYGNLHLRINEILQEKGIILAAQSLLLFESIIMTVKM